MVTDLTAEIFASRKSAEDGRVSLTKLSTEHYTISSDAVVLDWSGLSLNLAVELEVTLVGVVKGYHEIHDFPLIAPNDERTVSVQLIYPDYIELNLSEEAHFNSPREHETNMLKGIDGRIRYQSFLVDNEYMAVKDLKNLIAKPRVLGERFDQLAEAMGYPTISEYDIIHEMDSTAPAGVILDKGSIMERASYSAYERITKIYIANPLAYNLANFTTPRYTGTSRNFVKVSGTVFNLTEEEGFSVSEMSKDNVDEERVYERVFRKRVSLPNVKSGSMVEIKTESRFHRDFRRYTWDFQWDVPVYKSEFSFSYDKIKEYRTDFRGYIGLVDNERFEKGGNVHHRWVAEYVPALKKEPFVRSHDNYSFKVVLKLKSVQADPYMSTWKNAVEELHYSSNYYEKQPHLRKVSDSLSSISDPKQLVSSAYHYIRDHMSWNGLDGYRLYDHLSKGFKDGVGSAAQINMNLIVLLKNLDIEAYPVLVKNTENGYLDTMSVSLNEFDKVIVQARVNGRNYLLDATCKFCPLNKLPAEQLNNLGLVVRNTAPNAGSYNWVETHLANEFREVDMINLTLNPQGILSKNYIRDLKGIDAINIKNQIDSTSLDKYLQNALTDDIDLTLVESSYDMKEGGLRLNLRLESTSTGEDIHIINLLGLCKSNFKLSDAERLYPIDLGAPVHKKIIVNFELPENSEIVDAPVSEVIAIGDDAKYTYYIQRGDKKLQLSISLDLNKSLWSTSEYLDLKNFFDKIVEKENEELILQML
ncbi:MAG: hypothetical protein RIF33_17500 [Cyclobacteriaceae bacterium]